MRLRSCNPGDDRGRKRDGQSAVKALTIRAGLRALQWLRDRGLRAEDVRIIPAAAGGPKGLPLVPLDQYLFGE